MKISHNIPTQKSHQHFGLQPPRVFLCTCRRVFGFADVFLKRTQDRMCSYHGVSSVTRTPNPDSPAPANPLRALTELVAPLHLSPPLPSQGAAWASPLRLESHESPRWSCPPSLEKERKIHWFCQPPVYMFALGWDLSSTHGQHRSQRQVKVWCIPTMEYYAAVNKCCHGRMFKTWGNVKKKVYKIIFTLKAQLY